MVSRTSLVILVVVTLVILAGVGILMGIDCAGYPTEAQWDFSVYAYEETGYQNDSFAFNGIVFIGGNYGGAHVKNVTLVFYDSGGQQLDSLMVGDFGADAQKRRNVTVTLSERPARVAPRPKHIDAHPDTEWFVVGLEWTGSQYDEVILQTNPEPWYCQYG